MSRIAFLSTAHIHTQSFIQNILEGRDGRRVAAIWDDNPARGGKYAAMAGAPFFADLDALLANPGVDGFVICAENTRHLPLLQKAIPVGKPILCEKPLLTCSADLPAICTLLSESHAPLTCGYFFPFSAEIQAISRILESGALGKVTRARFVNAHHAAYGGWFDTPDLEWFRNPALSGGGAFMDLGTHALHLLRTLFGPVREIWADFANQSGIYPEVEDYGVAHLRFASGVFGEVEAAWTQTGGIGGLTIIGSQAALWNTQDGYVLGEPGGNPEPVKPADQIPTRVDRLVGMIRGQIPQAALDADLAAICDAVILMETAQRSARSRSWVDLPAR